ncbi:hypothetical protein K1Y78_59760, partial [Streptomyces sp. tea 10]|nr:hypothetical protein [Streptomyces sp. tea 10]
SVRVGGNKVAHLSSGDAHRYWHPLSRVIASGYTPVVPLHLEAELQRQDGQAEVAALAALTVILVLVSIILLGVEPLATTLVLIVAVATGFMAFYLHRTL